jgi:SAM-dependent methyltransferase
VSFELARRASAGSVLGVDVDEAKLEICRDEAALHGLTNVRFEEADITAPLPAEAEFDVVYVRFVLTHLLSPADALANLHAALAPGGVILVEDIDFTGHFCYPDDDAFWRYVDLYTRAVQSRGCDPNIGPRLPSLLVGAGFDAVGMNVVQPAGMQGEVKLLAPITLEAIADAVLAAELCGVDELERTVDDLHAFAQAEGTVLSFPRIVQSWGRRRP